MTEKRFTSMYNEQSDMIQYVDTLKEEPNKWSICNVNGTLKKLNELHEENEQLKDALNQRTEQCDEYYKENEQLKKELKVYRKVASCSNCKYHNYDWNIDDGYGGEEYEVCDRGNDVTDGICEEWEEL